MKKIITISISVGISLAILAVMIWRGYDDLVKVVTAVKLPYLLAASFASAGAYIFMGLSLKEALYRLGQTINSAQAVSIAFVSSAANYVVSSFGVSGFALRAHLLKKRGVPFGTSVISSVLISVLLYLVLALIILQASVLLLIDAHWHIGVQIIQGIVGFVVIVAICTAFLMGLLNKKFRSKITRKLFISANRVAYSFSKTMIPKEDFNHFEKQLEEGVQIFNEKKHKFTGVVGYILLDWVFTLLILYFGFKAVGVDVSAGHLVCGFALGMVATLIPVLPSGLGAMELGMTAAFAGFGIDWNAAFVASLIYRVFYYVIPAVLSIFVFWGLKISEPLDLAEELAEESKLK